MDHGATKIHGSLAFHGLRARVKIHHQIWKHAFQIQRKIIDNIGYIENVQTQVHTNKHQMYEILLESLQINLNIPKVFHTSDVY